MMINPLLKRKHWLMTSVLAFSLAGAFTAPSFLLPAPVHAQVTAQQPFSFADVIEKVQPAVVSIQIRGERRGPRFGSGPGFEMPDNPFEEFFRHFGQPGPDMPWWGDRDGRRGERRHDDRERGERPGRNNMPIFAQGSGFFISADGYVVTNYHVVEEAESVSVLLTDGSEHTAKVIGADPKTDLALVKIDGRNDFPFVAFSKEEARVGDWVIAVGNPFGLGGSATAGIISARGRDIGAGLYNDFLQIDAPINRGNSGGPAFNLAGEVVGVNTAIYSPSGGSVGIGFAIPAETVASVVADLKDDGRVVRGWLGVQIQPVTEEIASSLGLEETKGALVAEPQPDSPALAAGVKAGDVILEVDGVKIESTRDLARKIAAYPPDSTVTVALWRDEERKEVKVTLGKQPEDPAVASLGTGTADPAVLDRYGLVLAPAATIGVGEKGVVVTELDPTGIAAEDGLREGDIILEIGGKDVSSADEVSAFLQNAEGRGREAVLLRVRSGDQTRFVALSLKE